jgi:LSD1 subclass zinc finger protein
MPHGTFDCGNCGTTLEFPDVAKGRLDVACWYCDATNVVNPLKMELIETQVG